MNMKQHDWIYSTTTNTAPGQSNATDGVITIDFDDENANNFITLPNTHAYDTVDLDNIDFNFSRGSGIDVSEGDVKVHKDGDIKIGDRSLKEFMDSVEERLNILRPNTELEQKWDELRDLGDKYRQLEQELLEKETMWSKLK